ncbi:conserved hypothetical protein [Neospora caninum Liverpool]|uniref:16S rRNA (uracil(1498)-N(3))-methyltransferase n=1 Tax=Neospora caninum (strain Liverpool) TaxID=572307 RepID=F0V837_NEOCL|nr:conserved hypothetical protein [Neospora caninum Liverpool]CBZ49878.1 conserved hypothetical protein [Neospora caninum Liverpool]CEL64467.1 TPA: RNA methyltransferase [Neospora caninum Liverpool]|eukprot:XP_003879913.1 conserved hypothetical protein [Neospora caninum Liverpool]
MNLILIKRRQIRRVRAGPPTAPEHAETARGDTGEEEEKLLVDLPSAAAQHCLSVLKVQVGSTVKVGVFNGGVCTGKVVAINGQSPACVQVQLERDIAKEACASPDSLIDLLLAIPRPKTLDKILQVSATLGVGRVLLVCSERVEKGYLSSPKLSRENIEKQLQTGLEQGVSTRVPEVQVFASWQALMAFLRRSYLPCPVHSQKARGAEDSEGHSFSSRSEAGNRSPVTAVPSDASRACGDKARQDSPEHVQPNKSTSSCLCGNEGERTTAESGELLCERDEQKDPREIPWCCFTSAVGRSRRLIAHPGVDATLGSIKMHAHSRGRVLVAIGPEGGWLDQEVLELSETQGFEFFSLGDRVLRCETAVVSVIAQLNMLLQDVTLRAGLPPACDIPEGECEAFPVFQGSVSMDACSDRNSPKTERRATAGDHETPAGRAECEERPRYLPASSPSCGGTTQPSKKGRSRDGVRQIHCDEDGRVIVLPQKFSQHRPAAVSPAPGE